MKRTLTPEQRTKHFDLLKVGSLMGERIKNRSHEVEKAIKPATCDNVACQNLVKIITKESQVDNRLSDKWEKLSSELLTVYKKL